jgi:hypothetical protein
LNTDAQEHQGADAATEIVRWVADWTTCIPSAVVLVSSKRNGWYRWRDPQTGKEWNSREYHTAQTPLEAILFMIRDDVELIDYMVELQTRNESDQHMRQMARERRRRIETAVCRLVRLLTGTGRPSIDTKGASAP